MKPILVVRLPIDATDDDREALHDRLVSKLGDQYYVVITKDSLKMQSEFEIVR